MTSQAVKTPPTAPTRPVRTRLGRGRSGIVYAEARLACKVFAPDRASTLVMAVLTGAPNPYAWRRAAVAAAVCRRRVVERLVDWWFEGRVRLPRTTGWAWNAGERAYEIQAERIEGRHALLRHPGGDDAPHECRELVATVLRPLQGHLADAGLDGLLWQAGLGHPVAAANFMRETRAHAAARWVWIDLESGVPALFPFDLRRLLTHYLPLSTADGSSTT